MNAQTRSKERGFNDIILMPETKQFFKVHLHICKVSRVSSLHFVEYTVVSRNTATLCYCITTYFRCTFYAMFTMCHIHVVLKIVNSKHSQHESMRNLNIQRTRLIRFILQNIPKNLFLFHVNILRLKAVGTICI